MKNREFEGDFSLGIKGPVLSRSILGGFSAEYQAIYDALLSPPDDTVAGHQNTLVEDWIACGFWALVDVLTVFAQYAGGADALLNWMNPGTNDATAVGAPAFVSLEGFTGASGKYINHNWNPTLHGVNYVQNSASVFCYARTSVAESLYDLSMGASPYTLVQLHNASGRPLVYLNSSGNSQPPVQPDCLGMTIATRDATNVRIDRNKTTLSDVALASIGIPNDNLKSLGTNVFSSYGTKQLSLVGAGGFIPKTIADDATDAFEKYMDAIGKGV